TSPFWISDNHTGLSTTYNSSGTPLGLVVTIPPAPGAPPPGAPTGAVFNASAGSFNNDAFLFATEQGTINGWRPALGTTAELLSIVPDGVFKGIATATVNGNAYIYAADFFHGTINVLPTTGASPLGGSFTDPT